MKNVLDRFLRTHVPALHGFVVRLRLLWRVFSRYSLNFWALRLFWNIQPYTMVGHVRLLNVYDLAHEAEARNIPGDFIECGVWKGGCAAILAAVAQKQGGKRTTWFFDSFEGLPEPTERDGSKAASYAKQNITGKLVSIHVNIGPLEDVERLLFRILKLPRVSVRIVKGWFQDTLSQQKNQIGQIAILRLDGDWYESTKCILENLYDNVVPGGYVIVDDYGSWEGCRKALDEFLQKKHLNPQIRTIDASGLYFQKP